MIVNGEKTKKGVKISVRQAGSMIPGEPLGDHLDTCFVHDIGVGPTGKLLVKAYVGGAKRGYDGYRSPLI